MELKKLLHLIKKKRFLLINITIACALITGIFSMLTKDEFELTAYLDLGSEGYQDTEDYKFDNYYRFENAKRLILSAEQWTKDRALVEEILEKANVNKDSSNIDSNPKATQVSDTTLRITWKATSKKSLEKIEPYLDETLQDRLNIVNDDTDIIYTITTSGSTIKQSLLSPWIMGLIGGGVGLWLGVLWVAIKGYIKHKN